MARQVVDIQVERIRLANAGLTIVSQEEGGRFLYLDFLGSETMQQTATRLPVNGVPVRWMVGNFSRMPPMFCCRTQTMPGIPRPLNPLTVMRHKCALGNG